MLARAHGSDRGEQDHSLADGLQNLPCAFPMAVWSAVTNARPDSPRYDRLPPAHPTGTLPHDHDLARTFPFTSSICPRARCSRLFPSWPRASSQHRASSLGHLCPHPGRLSRGLGGGVGKWPRRYLVTHHRRRTKLDRGCHARRLGTRVPRRARAQRKRGLATRSRTGRSITHISHRRRGPVLGTSMDER